MWQLAPWIAQWSPLATNESPKAESIRVYLSLPRLLNSVSAIAYRYSSRAAQGRAYYNNPTWWWLGHACLRAVSPYLRILTTGAPEVTTKVLPQLQLPSVFQSGAVNLGEFPNFGPSLHWEVQSYSETKLEFPWNCDAHKNQNSSILEGLESVPPHPDIWSALPSVLSPVWFSI